MTGHWAALSVSPAFVGSRLPLPEIKAGTAEGFAQRGGEREREIDGFLEGLLLLGALPLPTLVHRHFQGAECEPGVED